MEFQGLGGVTLQARYVRDPRKLQADEDLIPQSSYQLQAPAVPTKRTRIVLAILCQHAKPITGIRLTQRISRASSNRQAFLQPLFGFAIAVLAYGCMAQAMQGR